MVAAERALYPAPPNSRTFEVVSNVLAASAAAVTPELQMVSFFVTATDLKLLQPVTLYIVSASSIL